MDSEQVKVELEAMEQVNVELEAKAARIAALTEAISALEYGKLAVRNYNHQSYEFKQMRLDAISTAIATLRQIIAELKEEGD